METILRILRDLGPVRVSAIGGLTIVTVLFFLFLTARLSTPELGRLYGNLSEEDSQEIVSFLAARGADYQIQKGGKEIYAPSTDLTSLRMSLAEEGLPRQATFGNELFDNLNTIGISTFMQEVTRQRALEGELARTIVGLETVDGARVHVVTGRRELFAREQVEPSATVLLNMRGVSRLNRPQVLAVQHLVSSAVEGLNPVRVSVLDERGSLLSGEVDQNSAASVDEMRAQYENRLAQRIEELLERTVGFGKVRAEVSADMDFSTTTVSEEVYDPASSVLRSSETIEENNQSADVGPNIVTVGGNIPEGTNSPFDNQGISESNSRTEERNNFEVSRQSRSQVVAPGKLDQLSVAVLVDGIYAAGDDGTQIYSPRGQEEMQRIETLVRSAIGFRQDRGDTVEVVNMPFAAIPTDEAAQSQTLFGFTMSQISRLLEVLLLTVFGVLVIVLLLRPLVTRIFEATPQAIMAVNAQQTSEGMDIPPGAIVTQTPDGRQVVMRRDGTLVDMTSAAQKELNDMVSIAKVDGQVRVATIKQVSDAIDGDPEAAVAVIRNWLFTDQNAASS